MIKRTVFILILSLVLVGCGAKKRSARNVDTRISNTETKPEKEEKKTIEKETPVKVATPKKINSTDHYISVYKDIAISEMKKFGIPASITLAQGILESGSGKGRLAVKANNHFGIKCHGWKGGKIYHDDDKRQECFRKYKSASESFRDHSEFLANRKRYAKLFKLDKDDYKGWARELRKAGYATDRRYPQKLISLIERYELYKYDDKPKRSKKRKEDSPVVATTYTVVKGDTLYSISRKYNITVKELQKLNGLTGTELSIGQILNIQPKQNN